MLCSVCQVAQKLYNEGSIEEAEKKCLEFFSQDPCHVENILLLGAIYYACAGSAKYGRLYTIYAKLFVGHSIGMSWLPKQALARTIRW